MEATERIDPFNRSLPRYSELIHLTRYSIVRKYVRGKTLDIACGIGYGSVLISNKRSIQYIGLDIDEKTIVQAQEKYGHLGFFSVFSEKENLPYDNNRFDTVCSLETIEHVVKEEQPVFFGELLRVLKPDGLLIISTPNRKYKTKIDLKKTGWNNPYHKYEFETNEFRQFLLTSSGEKVEILHSYYLGFPYNITGAIHKHRFEWLFRKLPQKILQAIDIVDIKLGFLFPKYCNSIVFVIRKNE